jgi:hypothetical protein
MKNFLIYMVIGFIIVHPFNCIWITMIQNQTEIFKWIVAIPCSILSLAIWGMVHDSVYNYEKQYN